MTKRPDQYQIDPAEAGATDYKSLRQTEAANRRKVPPSPLETGEGGQNPKQTMESRRRQSEADREKELERAAGVRDRGEGADEDRSQDESEDIGGRSEGGEL